MCNYFEIELSTKIKSTVSSFLNYWPKELIGLDAYFPDISEQITPQISDTISAYGLGCVVFSLLALDIDTTKYEHFDEINIGLGVKSSNKPNTHPACYGIIEP